MRKVFLLLFLTTSLLSHATIYYIDPSGNNSSGDGTINKPWATLAHACGKVTTPGDIIHVNAGNYYETVQSALNVGVSIEGVGTASNIISSISAKYTPTIHLYSPAQGTNGNQSISNLRMDGNNLTAYCAIWIEARSNVSIHDLTIVDFRVSGVTFNGGSVYLSDAPGVYARGNTFYNNNISNCAQYASDTHNGTGALQIGGQDGLLVYNNILEQTQRSSGENGYLIKYYSNGFCKGVKIYNNKLIKAPYDGISWNFAIELWNSRGGIEIYQNDIQGSIDFGGNKTYITNDEGGYGYSVKVYNNVIGQASLRAREEIGMHIERANIGGFYVYNNLFKNLAYPFLMYQGNGDQFRDLFVYNNIFSNIGIYGQPNLGTVCGWGTIDVANITYDNINFINNTIYGNSDGGKPINGLRFTFPGKASNVSLKNNIIRGFAVYPIYIEGGTIDNLSIENNLYYGNGINDEGISQVALTNFTNQNNRVGDPLFVSSSDFHLSEKSPCIGAGVNISYISADYEGKQVSNPPSLGCYATVAGIPDPSYSSSSIENAAPAVIEMNYTLSLANIIPATSAFSVQVNSAARSVNSVSISGTKVLLTLSSPVAYGNTVTVAYTKPSTNPIQTSAGGQAANLSAQTVTNRVAAPPPPPAVPAFSGAAVENTAPSVIVMTYSLTLAAIIPTGSAFSVTVNSAARTVSSVSVSGTTVSLTLTSPVVYGNTVTVAYTAPSSNPLQTSAGGKVVSFAAKAVTNRVNAVAPPPVVVTPPVVVAPPVVVTPPAVVVPNNPPVPVVSYNAENFSGFTGVINANGTYDANMDKITFSWKIPANIPVSSTNTAVIEYLAPVIQNKQTFEFVLTVSDGKSTQSKKIPVDILPYQPDLQTAEISEVEATDYNLTDVPSKAVDGNTSTMWSCNGTDHALLLKLKSLFNIKHIMLAFQPGQAKESFFDIYCSTNGQTWDLVLAKAKSCSFSGNLQIFDFPDSKSGSEYCYIKLVGLGNSVDNWNYVSEFRIFGYPHENPADYEDLIVKIYPNPASEFVNILIDEPGFNPDFIKIVSSTGKVMYSEKVDPAIRLFQMPVSLKQGVYIVQMGTGDLTMFTQKLIISR